MIRDRIKSFERVPVESLKPHPQNWRQHPESQREAMRAALDEIGYADALLVREDGDGYQLVDGHLRADMTPYQEVPVLVLDVDEDEAKKLLATFDPIGEMSEPDLKALGDLQVDIDGLKDGEVSFDVVKKSVPEKPEMLWMLVGIESSRADEITQHVDAIKSIEGIFFETSLGDKD